MKNKTISRPLKFVYLFMVAVILFSMATMVVSAANVSDTRHTNSGYINHTRTDFRYKTDDTSCYVFNDASSHTISVMVYGNTQVSWSGATNKSALSYGYAVDVGDWAKIPSWVYEDITSEYGQGYAALDVWTATDPDYEYVTFSFLWSPDSV